MYFFLHSVLQFSIQTIVIATAFIGVIVCKYVQIYVYAYIPGGGKTDQSSGELGEERRNGYSI